MMHVKQEHIEQNEKNRLTEKIKRLEGVNYIIAHNLRGVGANIKMLAEVLINKHIPNDCLGNADNDMFTTVEAIQYIHECSNSMLETLSSLMEVASAPLGDEIRQENCDVGDVIHHITKQVNGLIQQKNAVLEFDLAVTHFTYSIPYLESMLYNLIHNALKYSRKDVPLKIKIATYSEYGRPVLSVKDNGLGIDLKRYGRKIFNLYQVFHSGYDSKGVGLYIIKSQIEALGGHIQVKSSVNEGSEFIVMF